jgi:DNA-binding transcriptional regulator YhcF (GntR family)
MTGPPPRSHDSWRPRCACGLVVRRSWDLVGHFLAVYPPHASQPLDDFRHADVTRLSVKLNQGPTEVWEIGTWARDPRKHLRVAAAIAMRSATGDLKPGATVTQRGLAQTYHVSTAVAGNAIAELIAAGILGRFGGRCNVVPRDLVERRNAAHRAERVLQLIASHVTRLEAVVSQLEER